MNILNGKILETVSKCQSETVFYENIFKSEVTGLKKNEFLLFIKPEITLKSGKINLVAILGLIALKLSEFDMEIVECNAISATYIEKYNIIAEHYGVINQLSINPLKHLSPVAKDRFKDVFNRKIEDVNVKGSLEFLKENPEFTPIILDYFNQNLKIEKLAGGAYVHCYKLDEKEIFIVNSFHPRQLNHYIAKGRSIITLTLRSNTSWDIARNHLIGSTNPANASEGSIRKELLKNKQLFGLDVVSSSLNGVHLSAGPVEGLIELMRYNSDFSKNDIKSYNDYSFGRLLSMYFDDAKIEKILLNAMVSYKGQTTSVFDLTENCDSDKAIEFLKEAEFKISL